MTRTEKKSAGKSESSATLPRGQVASSASSTHESEGAVVEYAAGATSAISARMRFPRRRTVAVYSRPGAHAKAALPSSRSSGVWKAFSWLTTRITTRFGPSKPKKV